MKRILAVVLALIMALSCMSVVAFADTSEEINFLVIEPEKERPTPNGAQYGFKVVSVNGDTNVGKYISDVDYCWYGYDSYTKDGDDYAWEMASSDVFASEDGWSYSQFGTIYIEDEYEFADEVYIISKYDGVVKDAVIYDIGSSYVEFDVFYDCGLVDWDIYSLEFTAVGPIAPGRDFPGVYVSAINGNKIDPDDMFFSIACGEYAPFGEMFDSVDFYYGGTEFFCDFDWGEITADPFFESFEYFEDYAYWSDAYEYCFRPGAGYTLWYNLYNYSGVSFSPECDVVLKVPTGDDVAGSFSEYYSYSIGDTDFDGFDDAMFNFYFNMGAEDMSYESNVIEVPDPITVSLHTPEVGKTLTCDAEVTGAVNYTAEYIEAYLNLALEDDLPEELIRLIEVALGDTVVWQGDVFIENGAVVEESDNAFFAELVLLVDEMSDEELANIDIRFNKRAALNVTSFPEIVLEELNLDIPDGKMLVIATMLYEAPFGPDEYYKPAAEDAANLAPTLSLHTPVIGKILELETELVGSADGVEIENYFVKFVEAYRRYFILDGAPLDHPIIEMMNRIAANGGMWTYEYEESYDDIFDDYGPVEEGDNFSFYTLIDLGIIIDTESEEGFYADLERIGFTVNGFKAEPDGDEDNNGFMWYAYPNEMITALSPSGPSIPNAKGTVIAVYVDMLASDTDLFWQPEPKVEKHSGWFMTGPDTHAMIIGKAIITLPHEFGADDKCTYCGYKKLVEEEVEVANSYESETEETEDVEVTDTEENPDTGLALAVIPAIVAMAVVAFKKR